LIIVSTECKYWKGNGNENSIIWEFYFEGKISRS
jgi:hypothetical protein